MGYPGHGAERGGVRVPWDRQGRRAGGVSQGQGGDDRRVRVARAGAGRDRPVCPRAAASKIGRASCRERVEISVVAVSLKKNKKYRDGGTHLRVYDTGR